MNLISNEEEYYSRQLMLEDFGSEAQLKLKNSRVLVIGAGGLGCPALQYLTAAGIGTIGIIDSDKVEVSNLHRQILFTHDDIGKLKAECAVEKLKLQNPYIQFKIFNEKLTVLNIRSVFENFDVIVDGSDNFPTRYLVNDACVLFNKILVHGAVNKFDGQVSVFNFPVSSYERSATYRCVFPSPPNDGTVLNCAETGVLGALPGIIGTIQATETIKIITEIGSTLANKLLIVDAKSMNFKTVSVDRNEMVWKDFPANEHAFSQVNYDYICYSRYPIKSIHADELRSFMLTNKNSLLIDVRELHEFDHIASAKRIPLSELPEHVEELEKYKTLVLICATGIRSSQAINILHSIDPEWNLVQVKGGHSSLKSHLRTEING